VGGTIDGRRVRGRLSPGAVGWALPVNPRRLRHGEVAVGDEVTAELAPEGPQRGDLAGDIATAPAASLAPGAFFDTLAQFYARPASAGSTRPLAGRTSARRASPR